MKEITINNKLTTNNKLNLPTTWTKQKMMSLLLITWLSVNGTEAGQAFNNCLSFQPINAYNALLNFDFAINSYINSGKRLMLCCNKSKCDSGSSLYCSVSAIADNTPKYEFGCDKIGQEILCSDSDDSGHGCGGVVGTTPITSNNALAPTNCPSDLTTIANYLNTITPSGINSGYAHWACPLTSPCRGLSCDWDNGGWTCFSAWASGCNTDSSGGVSCEKNCTLQWVAPFPSVVSSPVSSGSTSNILTAVSTSSGSFSSSSTSLSFTTLSSTEAPTLPDKRLGEIIGIPVGIIGTVTIGGITYYLYKKRKNKQNQQANNQDGNLNDELFELANISQPTVKSENIGQPIFTPTPVEPEEQPRSTSLGMPVSWEFSAPTEEVVSEEVSNTDKLETYLGTVIFKSTELSQLVIQTKQKVGPSLAMVLETLLDTQTEITHGNNNFAVRQLQREAKEKLLTKLSEEEINHLCQLQKAVVQQEELQAQIEVPF
jgi:hypothetical protein